MSFRRLFGPNHGRFLILTGRRPASTTAASATSENTLMTRGRRLKRPAASSPTSPITQMRLEFRHFLDTFLSAAPPSTDDDGQPTTTGDDTPHVFDNAKMKEMLKRVVEVGDVPLFEAMLDAVPDGILHEIDEDQLLRSFAMVKLTEVPVSKPAAETMYKVLSRLTRFDSFLCELLMTRIVEESDMVVLDSLLQLLKERQWPFPIDPQMTETLITDVYLPNRRFDAIKEHLTLSTFATDTYSLVLLAIVNPDPMTPTVPQYSELPAFLDGIKKCDNLADAIEDLFSIHPPPDHILHKLVA